MWGIYPKPDVPKPDVTLGACGGMRPMSVEEPKPGWVYGCRLGKRMAIPVEAVLGRMSMPSSERRRSA